MGGKAGQGGCRAHPQGSMVRKPWCAVRLTRPASGNTPWGGRGDPVTSLPPQPQEATSPPVPPLAVPSLHFPSSSPHHCKSSLLQPDSSSNSCLTSHSFTAKSPWSCLHSPHCTLFQLTSICSTGQLLPRGPWPPWCGSHISQYSPGRLPVSSPAGPCSQPSTVVDPQIQSSKHSSHPNQALHPKPTLHPKSSCWARPLTLSL